MSKTINLTGSASIQKNEASSGTIVVLYDNNPDIKERADKMAYQVFQYCYRVLRDAKIYDFTLDIPPSLNLEHMVEALQIFSDKLDVICNRGGDYDLEYENINRAINAREQLRRLQSMVQALKDDDKNRYLQAIGELESQAMN